MTNTELLNKLLKSGYEAGTADGEEPMAPPTWVCHKAYENRHKDIHILFYEGEKLPYLQEVGYGGDKHERFATPEELLTALI